MYDGLSEGETTRIQEAVGFTDLSVLETRRQKLKAEMVYKSLNGLTPNYLSSKFVQRSDVINSYNLRDSDDKLASSSLATY